MELIATQLPDDQMPTSNGYWPLTFHPACVSCWHQLRPIRASPASPALRPAPLSGKQQQCEWRPFPASSFKCLFLDTSGPSLTLLSGCTMRGVKFFYGQVVCFPFFSLFVCLLFFSMPQAAGSPVVCWTLMTTRILSDTACWSWPGPGHAHAISTPFAPRQLQAFAF